MDRETEMVFDSFRHIHPELTERHIVVYRLLWGVEPVSAEKAILQTGFSRGSVFMILKQLMEFGMVCKTGSKPIGYYAISPEKVFSEKARRLFVKLTGCRTKIASAVSKNSDLRGEIYLVERGSGQALISRETRRVIANERYLSEIRRAVDSQLEQLKAEKAVAIYR